MFNPTARRVTTGAVIPKVGRAYHKGWATSSKEIHGYISVMGSLKFIID